MDWFIRDFDHPLYFEIYQDKEQEAFEEGPALARLLDLPEGSLLLDLPCGWGRLRPWMEQQGLAVVGGDLSARNLQRQQQEFPGPSVRLDFRRLPFRNACADGVLCAYTSWGYFATDQENLHQLQEYARVLRAGGVLLLDLAGRGMVRKNAAEAPRGWYPTEGGYRERIRWSPDGRRIYTERDWKGVRFQHVIWIPEDQEVRAFLGAAGFDVQRAYGGLDGHPWHAMSERWIYRAIRRP